MKCFNQIFLYIIFPFVLLNGNVFASQNISHSPELQYYKLKGKKHLLHDYQAKSDSGNIYVVIEIPSGTTAKWEVDKKSGNLEWESKKGKPRKVQYLPYPGNYGMIPQTLFSKELGGDGDPIDVIVLGPSIARGSVVEAKIIGVLKLLDNGEQDDKLIAVLKDDSLYKAKNLVELETYFPGVKDILRIWFTNYKGPDGKMKFEGYGNTNEAKNILDLAINAYKN